MSAHDFETGQIAQPLGNKIPIRDGGKSQETRSQGSAADFGGIPHSDLWPDREILDVQGVSQGTKTPWPMKAELIGAATGVAISPAELRAVYQAKLRGLDDAQRALRRELSNIENKRAALTYLVDLLR